eukprot:1023614-Prymnesium_polylepis.1
MQLPERTHGPETCTMSRCAGEWSPYTAQGAVRERSPRATISWSSWLPWGAESASKEPLRRSPGAVNSAPNHF